MQARHSRTLSVHSEKRLFSAVISLHLASRLSHATQFGKLCANCSDAALGVTRQKFSAFGATTKEQGNGRERTTMKKVLIVVAVLLVALGGAAFIYRDQIGMIMAFNRLKPTQSFAEGTRPAEPDYANSDSWAALPDRQDAADALPPGVTQDAQATAAVDVFFIHPTTYFGTDNWNQPLDDANVNQLTDYFVMRGQASAFNGCCKIYAPRYRQATIYSFLDNSGNGKAALEVAYGDVERAFDYFLEHYSQGRPFVLASHSQGSVHLRTLLEKRITGTPLRERLVAAYPIGFSIDGELMAKAVPDVPVCQSAQQIGCVVTWNSIGPNAATFGDPLKNICVNPLTWHADGTVAESALNIGAVTYPGTFSGTIADVKTLPQEYLDAKPVEETAVADAQCIGGMLLVKEIRSKLYEARPMGRDNYHVYDYSLFYMNIRKNAEERVAQYLAQHPEPAT
jgi:hypothetical protein